MHFAPPPRAFSLPLLEDANAVQIALMRVIQMLGSSRLDHKTAGLMLYALQTASGNLRRVDFEPLESTTVVIDRNDVHRTSIEGPQWFEEDFEPEESDEEDEDEVEAEDGDEAEEDEVEAEAEEAAEEEETAAAKPAKRKGREQTANELIEETRQKVAGVLHNYLRQQASEKAAVKPG
jgi:hypothetical protein